MKCIFALNPHGSITEARRALRPAPMKRWHLPFAKVLRWRKLRKGVWGVLLCIWQQDYIVINIASRCFERNSLCFILRFLAGFILRLRTLRRVGPSRQMHLPWWNTFAIPLQQWPRDYSQFTLDFKKNFFFILFWKWTTFGALIHIATTPTLSAQKVRRMNGSTSWHISIQFQG